MPYQATATLTSNNTLPLNMPDASIPLDQAAAEAGVSPRTLRDWCILWPGLGRRVGRGWRVDPGLLAQMVALRQGGQLTVSRLRDSAQPAVAPAPVPPEGTLSIAEAAIMLHASRATVWRYCEVIPGFGVQAAGVHGQWRVDPAVATIVGAIRVAGGGRIPIGVLVKETAIRQAFLRVQLTMLRKPEMIAQARGFIRQMKARAKTKRTDPPATAAAQPVAGEVRDGTR